MTRSELMAVMTGGFATVSGGVMGAYVKFLTGVPNIAGHLVIASIISAPAALAIAKVMVPETEESDTAGTVKIDPEKGAGNVMEAAAKGATDGMKLALNIGAMLIAFVALVAMFDWFVGWVPVTFCEGGVEWGYTCEVPTEALAGLSPDAAAALQSGEPLTLSRIFGWFFAPIAFVMGVPWSEATAVGRLLGEKIMLTEFIAYMSLGELIHSETAVISERSAIISSYALCGFANFASIGVQLGGIGGIAPRRMQDLASLGLRAMFAGVIAACMTGAIAGLFL
jgi:CNT family concentrative nucleoside transporter